MVVSDYRPIPWQRHRLRDIRGQPPPATAFQANMPDSRDSSGHAGYSFTKEVFERSYEMKLCKEAVKAELGTEKCTTIVS